MSVLLTWLNGSQTVEASFDAVVTETHTHTAQVTSHPVERGTDIADHVYIEPLRLTLEALVTNTPHATPRTHNSNARGEASAVTGVVRGARVPVGVALQFDREMQRPLDVWLDLKDAFDGKRVIQVVTAVGSYDDMVMVGLSAPREAGSGLKTGPGEDATVRVDKLTFSIEMQQIRTVSSKEGETRQPKDGSQGQKKNKGDKPKREATEQDNRGADARLWDSVVGGL